MPGQDMSGRDRLVSNVLCSWMGYSVFIAAGFIVPRMIDSQLGQETLGIWDFAWSLVGYFNLVQMGISSSVNRYVAKYRAAGDIMAVNCAVSSASSLLVVAGILVIGLTAAVSILLPRLFGARLGDNVCQAQWVVLLLGATIACEIALSTFSGILTGCHSWGLHNAIKSSCYAATVVAMMVALYFEAGLAILGAVYFAGQMLSSLLHMIFAYRVCTGLQLRPSLVKKSTIKDVFGFGGKTILPSVSHLLVNQTTAILIVAYLGPAALALYARPKSLVRHVNTLVNKMAFVLTPTASALQKAGDLADIRSLLVRSVRYSCYLVLPITVVLVVFGGPILGLWMGPEYASNLVPAILVVGHLAAMINLPVMSILAGLNAHGRAGIAQLIGSGCTVGLTCVALGYLQLGLIGAAIAITLPLTIVNAVYLPLLVCRRIELELSRYLLLAFAGPVVQVLPFGICLVIARVLCHSQPLSGLAWGGIAGGALLAAVYWRYALPHGVRSRVLHWKIGAAVKPS